MPAVVRTVMRHQHFRLGTGRVSESESLPLGVLPGPQSMGEIRRMLH